MSMCLPWPWNSGDRVYARSVQQHGQITPRMAEEGMRVFDAYLGLYLPPYLPKRAVPA